MTKDTSRFADCDTGFVVRLELGRLHSFVAISGPPAVFGSWSALFANLQLLTMVGLRCQVGISTCQAHDAVVDRSFRAFIFDCSELFIFDCVVLYRTSCYRTSHSIVSPRSRPGPTHHLRPFRRIAPTVRGPLRRISLK